MCTASRRPACASELARSLALAGAGWAAGLCAERLRDVLLRTRREDCMVPFWERPALGLLSVDPSPFIEALPVRSCVRACETGTTH